MLTVIVSSVVLIAVGALATFSIVQLLPQELLAKAEKHGRFAGLGDDQAVSRSLRGPCAVAGPHGAAGHVPAGTPDLRKI